MAERDLPSAVAAREAGEIEGELATLEAALARLEKGGYGRCARCGSELDDAILAADPAATTCRAHEGAPATDTPATLDPSESGAVAGADEAAGGTAPGPPSGPAAG